MEIEIPSDHPEIVSTGITVYYDGSKHFDGSGKIIYDDQSQTFRTKRVPKKYVVKKV